ncbi:MAG: arylsulfatase [Verrucomicrobiales bacterium]
MQISMLLLLALAVLPQRLQGDERESGELPNIVVILADDMGSGDVAALNPSSRIPTPNLDRIAAEGMTFTDAHTPSAVCTPTRYGLLTGRYCWRTRLKRGVLNGYGTPLISPERATIASVLRASGYATGIVGKWHLGLGFYHGDDGEIDFRRAVDLPPNAYGFESSYIIPASLDFPPYVYLRDGKATQLPTESQEAQMFPSYLRKGVRAPDLMMENCLDTLTEEAIGYIRQQTSASQRKPFLLYFPLTAPHKPVLPHPRFRGRSGLGPYGDFVMQVDACVGSVMEVIEATGIADNTLLIFTSDNGSFMHRLEHPSQDENRVKDHTEDVSVQGYFAENHRANHLYRGTKADVWEGGHRVPFLVRWPGKVVPESNCGTTICLTDVLATCAELVGAETGDQTGEDSFSFLGSLLRSGGTQRPPVIHHSSGGMFAIRSGKWKLVLGNGSGGREKPKGTPFSKPWQLFDMEADPTESRDVLSDNPEVAGRLEKEFEAIRAGDYDSWKYGRETILGWFRDDALPEDVEWWKETDRLAVRLDDSERRRFWQAILALPTEGSARDKAIERWIKGWSRADIAGAFEFFWRDPDDATRMIELKERARVFKEWAKIDIGQGLRAMREVVPDAGEVRTKALERIVDGVLEVIDDGEGGEVADEVIIELLEELSHDPSTWQIATSLAIARPRVGCEFSVRAPPDLADQMQMMAAEAWAKQDLLGAARWSRNITDLDSRYLALDSIIVRNEPTKLLAARDVLLKLYPEGSREYDCVLVALLPHLLEKDTPGALDWLLGEHSTQIALRALSSCANRGLLTVDAHLPALDALYHLPLGPDRNRCIDQMVGSLAQVDWAVAQEWVKTRLPDDPAFSSAFTQIIWSAKEPGKLIDDFTTLPEEIRTKTAGQLAWALARHDVHAALAWVLDLDGKLQAPALKNVVNHWASRAPREACDAVDKLPAPLAMDQLPRALYLWSRDDLLAACSWCTARFGNAPESDFASTCFAAVLRTGIESNARMIAEILDTLPLAFRKKLALDEDVAIRWALVEPEAAVEWSAKTHEAHGRDLINRVMKDWVERDYEAVVRWMAGADSEVRDFGHLAVIHMRAEDDPSLAYASLLKIKSEPIANEALTVFTDSWTPPTATDQKEIGKRALAMLEALPEGDRRDALTTKLAKRLQPYEPRYAFLVALKIGDEVLRQDSVSMTAKHWQTIDPAGAAEAILAAPISDLLKATLIPQPDE